MNIEILKREKKNNRLDVSPMLIPYLITIKCGHPVLWNQLKQVIRETEDACEERERKRK